MDDLNEWVGLLEDRLSEHYHNGIEVQRESKQLYFNIRRDANALEEKTLKEVREELGKKKAKIFDLVEKLRAGGGNFSVLKNEARKELSSEWKYEVEHCDSAENFVDSYNIKISSAKIEREFEYETPEVFVYQLLEHLDKMHDRIMIAQGKLTKIWDGWKENARELEKWAKEELEPAFAKENSRLRGVVNEIKEKTYESEDPEEVEELTRKARLTLLRNQRYAIEDADSYADCEAEVIKEASLEFIDFEERNPRNFIPSFTEKRDLSLSFAFFDEDEVEALKEVDSPFEAEVKMWVKGLGEDTSRTLTKELTLGSGDELICLRITFTASTTYCLKMRIVHQGMSTQWSDEAEFTTPEFKECCVWKECPANVHECMKYSVDEENPRIATKIGGGFFYCTIIGNTPLPLNKVTSWSIKILNSWRNDGGSIFIGVAPSDVYHNEINNTEKCGWYFGCSNSDLRSGPPHNYKYPGKAYGPRKGDGEYVHTGDSVGVVMDTAKGELSFALNGVNLGVAFEGIPLDKALVPCVVLGNKDNSIELVI